MQKKVPSQLLVDSSVSFRNGCYRCILCIQGSIYSFGYSLQGPRRTAESVMTKFGFIRSGKGEIFWRLLVYPFCFDVSMNSKE